MMGMRWSRLYWEINDFPQVYFYSPVKVLPVLDGEDKPSMDYIYEMDQA